MMGPSNVLDMPDAQQATQTPRTSIVDKIDRDELAAHILGLLKEDIRDREDFGWVAMREYDQLAYDGVKPKVTEPWNNASNYAVCLTPTLVDTAHANVIGGIYSDTERIVDVHGVGLEDIRTEKHLESLLNWQILNDIEDSYDTIDKTIKVAFKHGNGCIKVIQGYGGPQKNKVIWVRVPIENVFLPINARGAQVGQTDHIFELIPLSENDKQQRKNLKDSAGKPIYAGIDELKKGNKIMFSTALDALTNVRDITSGTSLGRKYSSDMYYILECYLTYWFTPKGSDESVSVELIVWMATQGGQILRIVENSDIDDDTGEVIRPYSLRWIPYPREDRIYGDSLPWLIKPTQEELDHAHNQNMNAAEELIRPYKFYDPTSGFDPELHQQVPNGWYPIVRPRDNIYIPAMDFNAIFERQFERYWEYAQRRTGLTELFQGRNPDREQTLGEAQLRTNKTEIRFKTVYDRFEQGFKELLYLTYFYDKKYMPKDTMIKVLGTADYQSINELFPKGMKGRYNFNFSSAPITETQRLRADIEKFYNYASINPYVANNPSDNWKLLNLLGDYFSVKNVTAILSKPKEANILSPQEAIQRIMSGQFDVAPDPGIDPNDYTLRIQMFMKTDTFANADPETKQAIMLLQRRVENIRIGQQMAIQDAKLIKQKMTFEAALAAQQGGSQNGAAQPGNAPPPGPIPPGQ